MPRNHPPHVESFRDRHGKRRCYFRRGKGARIPLPADPSSDEFKAAYAAALAGNVESRKPLVRAAQGSIAALIVSYKKSADWHDLRETTHQGYSTPIRYLQEQHGHRMVASMTREGINRHVLQPFADRPGQRLAVLKMLRVLIRHAIDIGALPHDPSKGIRKPKSKEVRSWTDGEIAQFKAIWPLASVQRLAFDLMLYTGQRRSDVHRMTWADVSDGTIRVVQQKTTAKLKIPLHRDLTMTLQHAQRNHLAIVTTQYGAARTVDGFSQWMREAISDAGLPLECKPHGLRKAAGRMLAEAGCSAKEIMAVLGHSTLAEAERYTRDADQSGLARAAIGRLEAPKANRLPQTNIVEFGENSKKKGKST